VSGQLYASAALPAEKNLRPYKVLDVLESRKISCLCRNANPVSSTEELSHYTNNSASAPCASHILSNFCLVKCTLVQALRLCTGRTAHRESRGIVLPFHDHGTRRGEGSASRPGRSLPSGKIGGWEGPRDGLDRFGKTAPGGIQSPERSARSQSLYRMSYPAHGNKDRYQLIFKNRASYIQDGCTATLQMLHFIYIFSTNISTDYFKHAAHSPIFFFKMPFIS
jgi:hypothetical protein